VLRDQSTLARSASHDALHLPGLITRGSLSACQGQRLPPYGVLAKYWNGLWRSRRLIFFRTPSPGGSCRRYRTAADPTFTATPVGTAPAKPAWAPRLVTSIAGTPGQYVDFSGYGLRLLPAAVT